MPLRKSEGDFVLQNSGYDLSQALIPSGTIMMLTVGSTSQPPGWIFCDGSSILRATYPQLFAMIGTKYGTSGPTTFRLPDLRGRFLRGWSGFGSGAEPTFDKNNRFSIFSGGATGDNIGTYQNDCFQGHIFGTTNGTIGPTSGPGGSGTPNVTSVLACGLTNTNSGATPSGYSNKRDAVGSYGFNGAWGNDMILYPVAWPGLNGTTRAPSMSTETRPVNANVGFWIKT